MPRRKVILCEGGCQQEQVVRQDYVQRNVVVWRLLVVVMLLFASKAHGRVVVASLPMLVPGSAMLQRLEQVVMLSLRQSASQRSDGW